MIVLFVSNDEVPTSVKIGLSIFFYKSLSSNKVGSKGFSATIVLFRILKAHSSIVGEEDNISLSIKSDTLPFFLSLISLIFLLL